MSGRGLGGMGLGMGGRHRRKLKNNIDGVTNAAIKRIARRGGVKIIGKEMYDETRSEIKKFVDRLVRDAVSYCDHRRKKTVTVVDVVRALQKQGRILYGMETDLADPPYRSGPCS